MSYEKFYPNGWQSGETGGTPITPEALNHMEEGIKQTYSDFSPAVQSAEYPGCYYRTVNGVVEWINPPMVLGVEYRTTERFNGKPIYMMAFYYGSLPASTGKDVAHGIANIRHAISVDITDSDIPSSWTGHHMVATCIFDATNVYVKTADDVSSRTVIAILKYTKTTD